MTRSRVAAVRNINEKQDLSSDIATTNLLL
jgi:hypothetical protein